MNLKIPKNDKYQWTQHAQYKMRQYGLSAQRITRVIKNPERIEEGIVEKTVAVMQPSSIKNKNGKKFWSQEIWAMYQIKNQKSKIKMQDVPHSSLRAIFSQREKGIKIISAWRYPGVSPKNNPIPEEILEEIQNIVL